MSNTTEVRITPLVFVPLVVFFIGLGVFIEKRWAENETTHASAPFVVQCQGTLKGEFKTKKLPIGQMFQCSIGGRVIFTGVLVLFNEEGDAI